MDLGFEDAFQEIELLKISDTELAQHKIENLLTKPLSERQRLQLKASLAYCFWGTGFPEKARDLYEEVLNDAIRLKAEEIKAEAFSGLGVIELDQGKSEVANTYFNQAIAIFQILNLTQKEAHTTNRLAISKLTDGQIDEARHLLNRTANLAENLDDMTFIQARNNLAFIYISEGDLVKAAEEFKFCMEYAKLIDFKWGTSVFMANFAETLQDLGEFAQAEQIYLEAMDFAQGGNDLQNYTSISA